MKKQDLIIALILFITAIVSRLPIVEKYMSHTDASSLTLAITNYDLLQQTPAPPGYPFYILIGKIFNCFLNDPYQSIILVSVLFSGICAIGFYLLGKSLGGRNVGIISAILFLSSPAFYFFGLTIYPYMMVTSMLVFLIWCVYEIFINKKKYGILLGIIYVLVLFTRPQELILTFSLFILGLYGLNQKERIKSLGVFLLGMASWVVPFLYFQGGLNNYLQISSSAAVEAIPAPSLTRFLDKKFELASGFYLSLGGGILILLLGFASLVYKKIIGEKYKLDKNKIIFWLVWILPFLIFNLFIRTEHAGYQAGYLIFFIFLVAIFISKLFKSTSIQFLVLSMVIAINLSIFFYDRDPGHEKVYRQSSFHFSDIRRNEEELSKKIDYIKKNYKPEETVIVAGPYLWRHARYYLPEYQIYKIDGMFADNEFANAQIVSAKDLKFHFIRIKNNEFELPKGTNNIILFDDDLNAWYDEEEKIVNFKGIAKIIIIPADGEKMIRFNFGKIWVSDK